MKTLLIGHTSGIGLDIANTLNDIIGVSKSTGFDISTDISKEYDYSLFNCIIINAVGLDPFSQIKTFFNIVEHETFDKKSLVIVLSSISAFKENLDTIDKVKYSTEKMSINKASRNLNNLGFNTSVICPGYVDTAWNEKRVDIKKLKTESVAKITKLIYDEYFNEGVLINEIVFQQR